MLCQGSILFVYGLYKGALFSIISVLFKVKVVEGLRKGLVFRSQGLCPEPDIHIIL